MMKQIDGFSSLLGFPKQFAHLMSVLEAAHLETTRDVFDWKAYRKLILDAQSLVDLLSGGDVSQ